MARNCGKSVEKLDGIMKRLLAPGGCPWDREQTHETLLKHLFSEADEVRRAVKKGDWKNLEEELGDVLLQVVFHAELARRAGKFDLRGVVDGISEKLVRRHPHVFGGKKLATAEEVLVQWNAIKKAEKKGKLPARKPAKRRTAR